MAAQIFGAAAMQAIPMLQSQQHHKTEVQQTHALHEKAIAQALELHEEAVILDKKLHKESIQVSKDLFEEEIKLSKHLHDETIAQEVDLHLDAKDLALRLHMEQLHQELIHHSQQMTHATETARRENLRDVWSQKTRKAETLMITNTLMFGCFFGVLVEGILPSQVWEWAVVIYSASLSISFSFLFLCMWFTMKNMSRMASFNIYNKHQAYTCGLMHTNFESYYHCHCSKLANLASQCFYIGSLALVIAAADLMLARFALTYSNTSAAAIYVAISMVTICSLIYMNFIFPTATRTVDKTNKKNKADTFSGSLNEHMEKLHAHDIDPALAPRHDDSILPAPHFADSSHQIVSMAGAFTGSHLNEDNTKAIRRRPVALSADHQGTNSAESRRRHHDRSGFTQSHRETLERAKLSLGHAISESSDGGDLSPLDGDIELQAPSPSFSDRSDHSVVSVHASQHGKHTKKRKKKHSASQEAE